MKIADRRKVVQSTLEDRAECIRVHGLVQGVGFRPAVWRLARELGLRGSVSNDGQGVTIVACGSAAALAALVASLRERAPPLARIESIERQPAAPPQTGDFRIVESRSGSVHTAIAPDAATCPACLAEIKDPRARRFRYPFTNCTDCGPRLSIIEAIPYDRAATTMRGFALCARCAAEYADPGDRRFHAQPVACPSCGPRAWLEAAGGGAIGLPGTLAALDAVDAAGALLQLGQIVAIKGLGGFQLACDAGNDWSVARLRQLKRRARKPFALMARDLEAIASYCEFSPLEAELLQSPAAPIVILETRAEANSGSSAALRLAPAVAPGLTTLGLMLPSTPLHHLLMQRLARPMVLTSGNLGDDAQCIANAEARARLSGITDYFLMHDRGIARRVDDSVLRVIAGAPRLLRRARGYAPAPIGLADAFAAAPPVLAMGGELKNTFCLLRAGQAIVAQHIGDLADALCHADYLSSIEQYRRLFEHDGAIVAVDLHPDYLSRQLGSAIAERSGVPLAPVQHHHAHIASCLAENGVALDAPALIGVALDGLGYGADGALWGGEFLLADYRHITRLASFKPVAMIGGQRAALEPWRNTYAQLMAQMDWADFSSRYGGLPIHRFLAGKARGVLDEMIAKGVNSPRSSSCGRLFDAVAAAVGVCREQARYEGQAAIEFEALVDRRALDGETDDLAYPFAIERPPAGGLPHLDPGTMWLALLGDLQGGAPTPLIAARFHKGLAIAVACLVEELSETQRTRTVALSGGVFHNKVLLEQLLRRLTGKGLRVLTQRLVPAGDGGLALGQAAVAAARSLAPLASLTQ